MRLFFDTSALLKRYLDEPGIEEVKDLLTAADELVVSVLCLPEMISTMRRLVREKRISEQDYDRFKKTINEDFEDIEVVLLSPEVTANIIGCIENNQIRTLDAVHVGCALSAGVDLFVSADRNQLKAASKEGLKIKEITASS
jgi:predicted nucleic acid-binding protein